METFLLSMWKIQKKEKKSNASICFSVSSDRLQYKERSRSGSENALLTPMSSWLAHRGKWKLRDFPYLSFRQARNDWQSFAIIGNHLQSFAIIGNWQSFAIIGNPPSLFWLTTESWLLSLLSAHFLFLLHSEGFCHKINIHVLAVAFGFRTDTHHMIN